MTVKKNKSAIIFGASSGVGRALANYLASLNYSLLIIARSERDLYVIKSDIENKYHTDVSFLNFDVTQEEEVIDFFKNTNINYFNEIYITIGKVINADNGEQNNDVVNDMIQANYIAPVRLINNIISQYNNNTRLSLLVISSIAVSRPRGNNVLYSSAKMALDFYCQAIQQKLYSTDLSISVCRLGYTDTEMVYGKKLLFPVADTHKVAKRLHTSTIKNRRLFYVPGFWKIIHITLNCIPWSLYKRLTF
jgi:short-subunit dehydrogenase